MRSIAGRTSAMSCSQSWHSFDRATDERFAVAITVAIVLAQGWNIRPLSNHSVF
jgi:hypothetical protein